MAETVGISAGPTDDEVVEERDVDGLGGGGELTGDRNIGAARGRVAARTVVDADDRAGGIHGWRPGNFARMGQGAVGRA